MQAQKQAELAEKQREIERQYQEREKQKREAYERQKGICPICNKHYEFAQMHGDHIKPWHAGGKTVPENLQMLCRDCNLKKSGQE